MHERPGIQRVYREMVRDHRDLSFESERARTMGVLLSAKGQRRELERQYSEDKRRLPPGPPGSPATRPPFKPGPPLTSCFLFFYISMTLIPAGQSIMGCRGGAAHAPAHLRDYYFGNAGRDYLGGQYPGSRTLNRAEY